MKKIKKILLGHACPGGSYDLDAAVEEIFNLMKQARRETLEKVEANIGFLRQWLNEKPKDRLVTNKDIEYWLFNNLKKKLLGKPRR